MANKFKWYDWILSLLIAIALVNIGTTAWFDFSIVEWMTFGVGWLATTIYSIVAVLGLIGLISLVVKLLLK